MYKMNSIQIVARDYQSDIHAVIIRAMNIKYAEQIVHVVTKACTY